MQFYLIGPSNESSNHSCSSMNNGIVNQIHVCVLNNISGIRHDKAEKMAEFALNNNQSLANFFMSCH